MKHPLIASAALLSGAMLLIPGSMQAAPMAYEGFDYAPDQTVSGLTGGTGWAAAWATGSGAFLGTNTAGSLTYQNLATTGGKLAIGSPTVPFTTTASPNRAMLNSSSTYTTLGAMAAANPTEAGTIWISFLYHRPDQTPNPYLRQANLGLFQGTSERLAIGAPNTGATVNNYLSVWSSGGAHVGATPLQSTISSFSQSAQFIVLKLSVDQDSLTRDDVWTWFNPADLSATPDTAQATLTALDEVDLSGITTFRFQAGNNNANGPNSYFYADEFRVGYNPFDVVIVPEPSTFCLIGLGLLGILVRGGRSQ